MLLCTAAHLLYTKFTNRFGPLFSETTTRPVPNRAALAQAFLSKDELCNSAAARAAYARLYGADTSHAATKGSRWEHRTKFHALKADLSALCAAQVLGQPFAATS